MKLSLHRSMLMQILAAQATPARAEVESYTLDPAHTFPSFEVNHPGFSPSAAASPRPMAGP
jgi:polyisoprenoid-binding protein YceI